MNRCHYGHPLVWVARGTGSLTAISEGCHSGLFLCFFPLTKTQRFLFCTGRVCAAIWQQRSDSRSQRWGWRGSTWYPCCLFPTLLFLFIFILSIYLFFGLCTTVSRDGSTVFASQSFNQSFFANGDVQVLVLPVIFNGLFHCYSHLCWISICKRTIQNLIRIEIIFGYLVRVGQRLDRLPSFQGRWSTAHLCFTQRVRSHRRPTMPLPSGCLVPQSGTFTTSLSFKHLFCSGRMLLVWALLQWRSTALCSLSSVAIFLLFNCCFLRRCVPISAYIRSACRPISTFVCHHLPLTLDPGQHNWCSNCLI